MAKQAAPPDLLPQARAALERHETEQAQGLLISIVVDDPHNEEAWLVLAETFDDLERRMECMQRARQLNPNSATIALAIQELKTLVSNSAFGQMPPAVEPAPPVPATPALTTAPPAPPPNPELAQILVAAANVIAQAIIMTMEPLQTRRAGAELVHLLERAQSCDAVLTRRWANTTGRAALVKYEKALTQLLTNMPQQDPQISLLREQRRQALDLFR